MKSYDKPCNAMSDNKPGNVNTKATIGQDAKAPTGKDTWKPRYAIIRKATIGCNTQRPRYAMLCESHDRPCYAKGPDGPIMNQTIKCHERPIM